MIIVVVMSTEGEGGHIGFSADHVGMALSCSMYDMGGF